MESGELAHFNSSGSLQCQLLKLSRRHSGCTAKEELKQVDGVEDKFLVYSLFEPMLREPTVRPFTDDLNNEDYFLLRTSHPASLQAGARARINDSFHYNNVIGMTLYDENLDEIVQSMRGVLLQGSGVNLDLDSTLVIIIADGCDVLNQKKQEKVELRAALQELGLYDEKRVKAMREYWDKGNKPPEDVCFVFESDLTLEENDQIRPGFVSKKFWQNYGHAPSKLKRYNPEDPENGVGHVRTLFVVKPYNKKKLHSHLWLMYGFCLFLNPLLVFVSGM